MHGPFPLKPDSFNISMAIYLITFLGYLIFATSQNKTMGTLSTYLSPGRAHPPLRRAGLPLDRNAPDGVRICPSFQHVRIVDLLLVDDCSDLPDHRIEVSGRRSSAFLLRPLLSLPLLSPRSSRALRQRSRLLCRPFRVTG